MPEDGEIYTPQGVSNPTKEQLLKHLSELKRNISLEELSNILNTTIKRDDENKVLTFLYMLLTYTHSSQQNIGYSSESSTGKSYIPLELSAYYPNEDVKKIAYSSPTAFFHEYGEWSNEEKVKRIYLNKKILIFLDMPHDQLLQRLRPLLSHDQKELTVKITDRSKSMGLATKSIILVGYPTVLFCSTRFSMDEQERTRLIQLSAEVTQEKIHEAILLSSMKHSDGDLFKQMVDEDPERNFLKNRVDEVKYACIRDVLIPENLREQVIDEFMATHEHLVPRHMRDFPRLMALIKAIALLNFHQKERVEDRIVAEQGDVIDAYSLYLKIAESNELGLTPEVLRFYKEVVLPECQELVENKKLVTRGGETAYETVEERKGFATSSELSRRYYKTHHRSIGKKRQKRFLEMLLECGLLTEDKHPDDNRVNIYKIVKEVVEVE